MTSWEVWRDGVLAGIAAPASQTNSDTLWAWSNAESGVDVMRWNNPLNTTERWFNSTSMNSVGVQSYRSITDGIGATVATLVNGHYPVILANLRGSVPRVQWGNACANLGTWGTGCGWLASVYGPMPGNLTTAVSSGGNMALAPHPSIVGRIDELVVGTDNAIWHLWGDVGSMTPAIESWGGQGVAGTLSAAWMPDGSILVASVAGLNGQLYRKALKVDGSLLYDWNPVHNAMAALPAGVPGKDGAVGPQGPPGASGKNGVTPTTGTISGPLTVKLG